MVTREGSPVAVHHEWGTLKEAIVGIGESMIVPPWSEEYAYLDSKSQDFVRQYQGRRMAEADPAGYDKMLRQMDHFVAVLESRGVIVHRPRPATPHELDYLSEIGQGICQLFTRDPVLVIGDRVIETALREPVRRRERFGIRDVLVQQLQARPHQYLSMLEPEPRISATDYGRGPFLEGGDVLLNGDEIYVGQSGHASNMAGVTWLQQLLGEQYRVTTIDINPVLEHLDCILSLPKPGLAVICREAVIGDLPASLNDWEFIDVSLEEARSLAVNGLILDENSYLCSAEHPRLADELSNRGLEVITVPFDAVTRWSGSMRCAHHPLVRESQQAPRRT